MSGKVALGALARKSILFCSIGKLKLKSRTGHSPPQVFEPLRRRTWNWLPTFLEVAETGSVIEASRRLHLTPAAVSRTVRLLERELGEPLFNRIGRSLVLNSHGSLLRDAVRSAASAVDRGLVAARADPFSGRLRVASLGVLTEVFVVPSLIALKREHAELIPEHLNLRTSEALEQLARGELDVAFYYEEVAADGVVVERLGVTSVSVYCGRGHPLFCRRRLTEAMVLEHSFSVPQIGDSGRVMDGWPTDLSRKVGMRITLLRSNLEVCRSGALLAVLPDVTAARFARAGELRPLPMRRLPDIEIFAGRPASGLERGAARALVERVREEVTAANRDLGRRRPRGKSQRKPSGSARRQRK
jgi:DNA-binding transcriptional LysR family regulator